jgi:glycolate oxidase iron-sulfur subunit
MSNKTKMKENTLEDIEKCVRCGTCKAVCPTHVYSGVEPQSARGRMVLLHEYLNGNLTPSRLLNERLYSCTLCGVCEPACPARVKVTDAIYEGRRALAPSDKRRRLMRAGARLSIKNPNLSFRTLKLAFSLSGMLIPRLLERTDFPFKVSLPNKPLRSGNKIFKPEKSRGRVALFTGCSVNYIYPGLGRSLINVLLAAGYEVVLPPGEVCCGEPLRALGLENDAVELAERNFDVFGKLRADATISLCPTCTLAIKVHYPSLIGMGIDNAMDITEFLGDDFDRWTLPNFWATISTPSGRRMKRKSHTTTPATWARPSALRRNP